MPGNPKRVIEKPGAAVSTILRLIIVFILILAGQPEAGVSAQAVLHQPGNGSQLVSTSPQALSASGQPCQWTYYPVVNGKLQSQKLLYNDPDNTPLQDLSLGNIFKGKSATLANTGSTDFDGDNRTDVFRTLLRSDHNLQWQYSSGGTGAWQNLNYASSDLPTSKLHFGNFNPDLKTDIFATQYNIDTAVYQWEYSSGGIFPFAVFNSASSLPPLLALGDFNGDGVTDVFTANPVADTYQWAYFPGGSGSPINLAPANTDPSLLRFGDFDGDGATDVFAALQQADGSYQWVYSSGGSAPYANLAATSVPYSELQFGDFNGDGNTDVMAAEPQGDGSLDVVYWPGGLGAGISMGHIPAPAPALRVGDFNGDGTSDLMAYRCGMQGPLAFSPLQTLATSGYGPYSTLAGDVNGDGIPDVILVSTCQNPSPTGVSCGSHYLQVGVALGKPAHTYTLAAAQQLSTQDFSGSTILAGDFNGDGKTDLALFSTSGTTLTIMTAISNGDGSFSLGSAQTFGGETWRNFNPITGDFNGDGKTDLTFVSVCNLSTNICVLGNDNIAYVALSAGGGVFNMGPRQVLSPATGWDNFEVYPGDVNGDGKTDLVFNSTCQKINILDTYCTSGDANFVLTALADQSASFTLGGLQVYGASGWSNYIQSQNLIGDVNGDGRADLVWASYFIASTIPSDRLMVVGFGTTNGSFQLGTIQNFGSAWSGYPSLVDFNQDGKADLLWNIPPHYDSDVDTYTIATSNGDGTFNTLEQGVVYTGQGFFQVPWTGTASKLPISLVIVSNQQNSISSALFVVNGFMESRVYLPVVRN